jgi:predicted RNase H-like nuclease (RuvC/YqgF family)
LLPKSHKHYIQPTAEELDCSLILVEDAVSFFYQELRKDLVEMKAHNIQVENLGSFKAKPGELPKLIHKYEKHLKVLQPETFNQMALRQELEVKLERVRSLRKNIEDERQRRREFYKWKNERNQNNLEEPQTDS